MSGGNHGQGNDSRHGSNGTTGQGGGAIFVATGAIGAAVFLRPEEFLGEEIDLAGDALTIPEALGLLARELGKPIQYAVLPVDQAEKAFGHDFGVMFRWFNEIGYSVDIPALENRWAIPLTKFRERVISETYQQRLQPKAA